MKRSGSLFTLVALLGAAPAAAGVAAVWAVSDGEKVERDDRAHPLKARNAVWDGRTVRLAAARNEVVAFQVIVEADGAGLGQLYLALPELRRRGGKEAIAYAPPATDPTLWLLALRMSTEALEQDGEIVLHAPRELLTAFDFKGLAAQERSYGSSTLWYLTSPAANTEAS